MVGARYCSNSKGRRMQRGGQEASEPATRRGAAVRAAMQGDACEGMHGRGGARSGEIVMNGESRLADGLPRTGKFTRV